MIDEISELEYTECIIITTIISIRLTVNNIYLI